MNQKLKFKQNKPILILHHINCPSKHSLEQMNLIEANIILAFVTLSSLHLIKTVLGHNFSAKICDTQKIITAFMLGHIHQKSMIKI